MLDPKHFEELIQRLSATLPKGIQVIQDDLDRNLRAGLESALARLDLVTREEFEVQAAVLARTRARLKALEKRVAELEQALVGHGAHAD